MIEPDEPTQPNDSTRADEDAIRRARAAAPVAGDVVGGYRIVGRLGEGGMGVVYEAEQASPRRRVALKVVRGGVFADPSQSRLLEKESQALARLRHPGIAAVHAAGRTEDGLGWFAMELVEGRTLDRYLESEAPSLTPGEVRRRLRLFLRIAEAVHYAHLRGVIHRDLKPSNIVVGAESDRGLPEVKVLDFGLARIVDADAPEASRTVELGVIKGTLAYMSPEQTRGLPDEIDLRSDVYALGVVLFQMVCGARPYEIAGLPLPEAIRIIVERPPRPPAQAYRGSGTLDPDVALIVAKALEKDPAQRYASVAALADDLERFLQARPILARPPTLAYRSRRFVRRNRVLVAGAATTFLALLGGVVVSTIFGLREADQRAIAEKNRDDLAAVSDFQAEMLQRVDPGAAGRDLLGALRERVAKGTRGDEALQELDRALRELNATDLAREVLGRNILDPASAAAGETFAGRPEIEARLLESLGRTYQSLGIFDRADAEATRLLEILERDPSASAESRGAALRLAGGIASSRGRFDDARARYEQALRAAEGAPGSPRTLAIRVDLAILEWRAGRYDLAEKLGAAALADCERDLGHDHRTTLEAVNLLGTLAWSRGRADEAIRAYTRVLEARRRLLGPEARETVDLMNNLGAVYWRARRFPEAEALLTEAVAIRKRRLGEDHPTTLNALGTLAAVYADQGRASEAVAIQRRIVQLRADTLGEAHPQTLRSMNNLGVALTGSKAFDDAAAVFDRLLATYGRPGRSDDPDLAVALHSRAELEIARGRWDAAKVDLERAIAIYRRLDHANRAQAERQLDEVNARRR